MLMKRGWRGNRFLSPTILFCWRRACSWITVNATLLLFITPEDHDFNSAIVPQNSTSTAGSLYRPLSLRLLHIHPQRPQSIHFKNITTHRKKSIENSIHSPVAYQQHLQARFLQANREPLATPLSTQFLFVIQNSQITTSYYDHRFYYFKKIDKWIELI